MARRTIRTREAQETGNEGLQSKYWGRLGPKTGKMKTLNFLISLDSPGFPDPKNQKKQGNTNFIQDFRKLFTQPDEAPRSSLRSAVRVADFYEALAPASASQACLQPWSVIFMARPGPEAGPDWKSFGQAPHSNQIHLIHSIYLIFISYMSYMICMIDDVYDSYDCNASFVA